MNNLVEWLDTIIDLKEQMNENKTLNIEGKEICSMCNPFPNDVQIYSGTKELAEACEANLNISFHGVYEGTIVYEQYFSYRNKTIFELVEEEY